MFNVPGVTFVASTGDYGAADPEYPAFSPNVVAVGGTSLTLNADNSYNSETGWGYHSDFRRGLHRLGRRHQPVRTRAGVPAGRPVHGQPDHARRLAGRRSGHRRVDRRPVQPRSQRSVRDRGRHEPVGPGLGGPGGAGQPGTSRRGRIHPEQLQPDRDASKPSTACRRADYNVISSGNNGYSADAGYNLVTGLGTPVANLLVPDLVAYQGPGTSYAGPTVAPLQNATLTNTGTSSSSPIDVFSVFDSLTMTGSGFGSTQDVGRRSESLPDGGVAASPLAGRYRVAPVAAGSDFVTSDAAVGMMSLDTIMTAHDAALTDWSSSRAAVATTGTFPGGTDLGPSISGRGLLALGRSSTPVLQAALVDAVLEESGALSSLLEGETKTLVATNTGQGPSS